MKKKYLILLLLLATSFTYAQVSQNFENITGITFDGSNTCYYLDANFASEHVLTNYAGPCGTVVVNSSDDGPNSTMGFDITFTPNGGVGFSDYDAFGVANAAGVTSQMPEGPIQGNNSFVMEDSDGRVTMRFGLVTLSGTTNPEVNLKYRLESTSWEADDNLKVYVEITGCASAPATVTLLDVSGTALDALEGPIQTLSTNLSTYIGCIAGLVVEYNSNSSAEEMLLDDINFTQGDLLSTLSTSNQILDKAFTVTPNPSNGLITIRNSGVAIDNVKVTDLNGRILANYNLNGTTDNKQLNLSSILSSGMYLMTISSKDASTVKKIVIR
jgi:hypothetical protein